MTAPAISSSMADVLDHFQRVQRQGGGYKALCPAHEDRNPSLSISAGQDGRVLLKCFAGCSVEDVCRSAHPPLTLDDLFLDRRDGGPGAERPPAPPRRIARRCEYVARDYDGREMGRHLRIDYAEGEPTKQMWWDPKGLQPATFPLYGSELVSGYDHNRELIIVEGEQACHALREHGYQALATYGADTIPAAHHLEPLIAFPVYLWADNDLPNPKTGYRAGQRHMNRMAALLTELGLPPFLIEWPDAPPKGDAADFLLAAPSSYTIDDLLGNSRIWEPSAPLDEGGPIETAAAEESLPDFRPPPEAGRPRTSRANRFWGPRVRIV